MTSANGAERFQIELPPTVRQRIDRLRRLAETQGRGASYRRTLRRLIGRLEAHAPLLGQTIYATPGAGLAVRRVVDPPVELEFVVYRVRRVVWVWRIDLTP
jgi:hypothetical protein